MIKINKNLGTVVYSNGSYTKVIPFLNINNAIFNEDELLQNITMEELIQLFCYGLPKNIDEYLIKKIQLFDSSSEVNSFIFKDKNYWFDKTTRGSLMNAINASDNDFTFVLGDEEFIMSKDSAKKFIELLELYAQKCFINTQKHLRAVKDIKEPTCAEEVQSFIDALKTYDYTSGYPEKIELV